MAKYFIGEINIALQNVKEGADVKNQELIFPRQDKYRGLQDKSIRLEQVIYITEKLTNGAEMEMEVIPDVNVKVPCNNFVDWIADGHVVGIYVYQHTIDIVLRNGNYVYIKNGNK